MKKYAAAVFAVLLLLAAVRGGVTAPAVGGAEIPASVWEAMDGDTRQALTEEPKYVALTFDDGPRRGTTDLLLNGLLERGASATFFVVGTQIPGNEDLIARMGAEGHQVGNHTYSHVRLLEAGEEQILHEIHKTEVLLGNVLGAGDYWLRPPYGLIGGERAALVKTPMIYWTLDPEDWKLLDAQEVTAAVVERVEPGDVILMHDFYPTSVDAALEIVDILQRRGYLFVTVEELFRIRGEAAQPGQLYAAPGRIRTAG